MTDNDYIAEYVRERYPGILGFDFAIWKMAKKISEFGRDIGEIFSSISKEDLKKYMEGKSDEQPGRHGELQEDQEEESTEKSTENGAGAEEGLQDV